MAHLLVLYATPPDPAAFDAHYTNIHIPFVHKIPNLTKFELSDGPILTPMGPSPFHKIATLHFPDLATLQVSMASPEARTAGTDAATFMAPGSHLLLFDTHDA
jgi:uncharacterized protein (TIGR02118 family)